MFFLHVQNKKPFVRTLYFHHTCIFSPIIFFILCFWLTHFFFRSSTCQHVCRKTQRKNRNSPEKIKRLTNFLSGLTCSIPSVEAFSSFSLILNYFKVRCVVQFFFYFFVYSTCDHVCRKTQRKTPIRHKNKKTTSLLFWFNLFHRISKFLFGPFLKLWFFVFYFVAEEFSK